MPDFTTPAEQERGAAMDADIVALRREGIPFDDIGRQMREKYGRTDHASVAGRGVVDDPEKPFSKQYMHSRWRKAIAAVPAKKIDDLRAELNGRLEAFLGAVEVILTRDHYAHSNGRVVTLPDSDGKPVPLLDDGPKLAAIAEGRKLLAEIRVLNGATVPVKQELGVDTSLDITINGVDLGQLK